jgi:N-acetylmuramoyl-L-alanine amidase
MANASIALAIMAFAQVASAAVIQQVSLFARAGTVEVDLAMSGRAARWYVSGHGQELWIDLEHARVAISARAPDRPLPFPLYALRVDDAGGGDTRVVLRVNGKVDYAVADVQHELIVRIAPSGRVPDFARGLLADIDRKRQLAHSEGMPLRKVDEPADHSRGVELPDAGNPTVNSTGAGLSAAAVRPVAIAPMSIPGAERPLVVIDAGHGGYDPGTRSADGIAEKTVALAIARSVGAVLEARGIRVELTRENDIFLSLAARTELANRAAADLFISIHLNSSPDRNTSGIEVYYLNNTSDRATIRLAGMENQGGLGYGARTQPNLDYILTNLRQDYKANESASLAQMIEVESAAAVETTLGVRVNALGAKKGPFYVLVGARMPSVLVECGFLSNTLEAYRLTQPNYRQALADGIAIAVMHYFNADAAVGNL